MGFGVREMGVWSREGGEDGMGNVGYRIMYGFGVGREREVRKRGKVGRKLGGRGREGG